MTVVMQGDGWWVESFTLESVAIADQAALVTNHILERAGIFLGSTLDLWHNASIANSTGINWFTRDSDNFQLSVGQFIDEIRSVILNDSGVELTAGLTIMVWLRKRGT